MMLKDKSIAYKVCDNGTFTIENYNLSKPFSSFLPGIAGPYGVPMWAFYVNRGQGMASFGVQDKDHAIMEFLPANRAYEEIPHRGFRTFIKVLQKKDQLYYEPFQNHLHGQRFETHSKMHIHSWGFTIEERNLSMGIEIEVDFFAIPNAPLAALARKLTIRNISLQPIQMEVLDGLPRIVPSGLDDEFLKYISRTAEAWMNSEIQDQNGSVAFFGMRSNPHDGTECMREKGTHFYTAFTYELRGKIRYPEYVIDPTSVFGPNLDFSYPREFLMLTPFRTPTDQLKEAKTPCAFSVQRLNLQPNQDYVLYSYFGRGDGVKEVNRILPKMISASYFEQKHQEKKDLLRAIQSPTTTISASKEYDLYCAQTYLDNALRGGLPSVLSDRSTKGVMHLYSRKHADLERDYNRLHMDPTYLSQGEGNYRDINQNRRCDIWFEPRVHATNVKMFFNLIQADGFNPLLIQSLKLKFSSDSKLTKMLKGYFQAKEIESIVEYLGEPRTPGEILKMIETKSLSLNGTKTALLEAILESSEWSQNALHGQGFWMDHWFYNLDLLENYLAIYPEELHEILIGDKTYTYYDNAYYVKPRSEKYVKSPDGRIRQIDAVGHDVVKERMIQGREESAHQVRTRCGAGKIYQTNLAGKIVCLIANKYASIDPAAVGMEMEADRPDWLDSLNGLPSLLGSSISGTFELIRCIEFLEKTLESLPLQKSASLALPIELCAFLQKLSLATRRYAAARKGSKSLDFWNATHEAKEDYWQKTRYGFKGSEKKVSYRRVRDILHQFALKLRGGIEPMYRPASGVCPTYFVNEITEFREIKKSRGQKVVIVPRVFKQRSLPIFLEGPVHALKIETSHENANSLYNYVRASELFDRKLGMYRVSASLATEGIEIGRIRSFAPGWLENASIFLHMEYKFLLEVLKKGFVDAYFTDLKTALVAFQDPLVYGRSPLENSSFIVSSAFGNKRLHGSGYAARLSGSTSEFLEMWLIMNIGRKPFILNDNNELSLHLNPALPPWLFTEKDIRRAIVLKNGKQMNVFLPRNGFAFLFLGQTLVTYANPKRKATYGPRRGYVKRITFRNDKGELMMFSGDTLPSPYARLVREGRITRLDAEIG